MAKVIRVLHSVGDYEYLYSRDSAGIEHCQRTLKNAVGQPPEEVADFQQLPESVRAYIASAQNFADGKIYHSENVGPQAGEAGLG